MLCNINVTSESLKALQSLTDQVPPASTLPSGVQGFDFSCQLWAPARSDPCRWCCAVWCSCQECLGWESGLSHLRNAQCCSLLRGWLTAQKCPSGQDCQGPEDTPSSPQPCQELQGQTMKPMKPSQNWSLGERGKKVPLPIFLPVAAVLVLSFGRERITSKGMGVV